LSGTTQASQTPPPSLYFRIPPDPSHLLRARERLRDYLRQFCSERRLIDDVVLCVEEAATNAIRHSSCAESIEITLRFETSGLVAVVKDRGRGFDVASFDPQQTPDLLEDHGRGLFLMAKLMDSLELRIDDGLEVHMALRAEPRCEPAPLEIAVGHKDARSRAMLEEIDEAFFALDWEYRYVYVNSEAERIDRVSRDDLLGRSCWDFDPQLRDSALGARYREAMELGRPSVSEHRSLLTGAWLEVRLYPTAAGICGYYREIGERKRIEQEVAATRAELAATLAAITDGFYTLDRTWRVTYLNDQAATAFPGGKAALGANFWELFPEDLGSPYEARKRRAMEHGEVCSFEFRDASSGAWFEERDYPSADGITVLFTDISARKRAEAERDQLLESTSLLLEATTTTASWTDFDPMLESLGDLLVRATDHSRVLLELWDEDHREVEIAVSRGSQATPGRRFAFAEISDAARTAITTRKAVVIDYSETGIPGSMKHHVDEHPFVFLLCVPLVYQGRLLGLITVDEPGQARSFSSREIELVETIASQAGAAIDHAHLLKRETRAARLDEGLPESRTIRLVDRFRGHRWSVLVAAITIQSAILAALNTAPDTRHVLGLPGSIIALICVFAGALAGPLVGALVALAGGGAFYLTVGGRGSQSAVATTVIATGIWVAAGLLSGFLARTLAEQAARRRAAAVALVRADAAREAQLAEQSRIEQLAAELQMRNEQLQAQGEALQMQGEELRATTDELGAQAEALKERARLAEALDAINALLHSTLDFESVMEGALEQAMDALATEVGAVELREHGYWVVRHQRGLPDSELGRRRSDGEAPLAVRAAASRKPFTIADLSEHAEMSVGLAAPGGLRSVISVPLIVRREVIGCLLFYERRPRLFAEGELDFARRLGVTVSLAIDNARLYLEQCRIAEALQENFIHELPRVAGLELGVMARTANKPELVGGDFSDVFVVDDTHVVVLIGDVAGKGVRAAGLTETVRSTVRALAATDTSPASILAKANELLLKFDPDEPHVTVFCAVLDPHTGHLSYASAGHPAPVHLGAFSCLPLTVTFGPPLGSFTRPYSNAHAMLSLEDYLVLYTDGVTEARRDGKLLGERHLLEIVESLRGQSSQEVADHVRDAAAAFAGGHLSDDMQVVVLRLA
jgi:PAS domain S-box-containing protein